MTKFFLWNVCLGAVLLSQFGCASGAVTENMVADELLAARRHPHSVRVSSIGGQETNPMWSSQISNGNFSEAIRLSIEKHGVFSRVERDESAPVDFHLEVTLLSVSQPAIGFDMTVAVLAEWALIRASSNTEVWRDRLQTAHTATVGDAFAGIKRLRLANEGAAKKNIERGLEAVSTASLGAVRR